MPDATMIPLTDLLGGRVFVNAANITYVAPCRNEIDSSMGALIHFVGGHSINVKESPDTVLQKEALRKRNDVTLVSA